MLEPLLLLLWRPSVVETMLQAGPHLRLVKPVTDCDWGSPLSE